MKITIFTVVLLFVIIQTNCDSCFKRLTLSGTVCVCNNTHCDTTPQLGKLQFKRFKIFTTSKANLGFTLRDGHFSKKSKSSVGRLSINKSTYQTVLGFGGAFTDATGYNIRSLPEAVQVKLMESYFGTNGIEYTLCRVPIGGCDFSPRPYSYDDHDGDVTLEKFKLQEEDHLYKIPLIKQAKALKKEQDINLFASAWTAPPWMKTSNVWTGYSMLKKENYQVYANYLKKFLEEYKKENIAFWGLTTGNEPMDGFFTINYSKINAMGWIPLDQSRWIGENLGPTLRNSSYKNLKIMILDDDRVSIPYVVPVILNDETAAQYVDGVAVHWYWDDKVPPEVMDLGRDTKKELFLLSSEACVFLEGVSLGEWRRGERYIASIIEYMNFGSVGWVDWNMALNTNGGPTYIGFYADSPIIVNATAGEFYKQPMFYALGHFSKFVIPGSVRVGIELQAIDEDKVKTVAFQRPDDHKVVVIFNNGIKDVTLQIADHGYFTDVITVAAKSINTILYKSFGRIYKEKHVNS